MSNVTIQGKKLIANSDGRHPVEELYTTNHSVNTRPIQGPQTQGRNRDVEGVTTIEEVAKWPSGANITEITVLCTLNAAPIDANALAALAHVFGKVVVDPINVTVATALMTALDSAVDDSGYFPIPLNQIVKIPVVGDPNAAGDILVNGSLGGGVLYGASSNGTTSLNFFVGAN